VRIQFVSTKRLPQGDLFDELHIRKRSALGRSLDEYVAMFSLTEDDLNKKILGCGDGPASFNAGLTEQGGRLTSIDPVFQFSAPELEQRIDATYDEVMEQTKPNRGEFVWDYIRTVEEISQYQNERHGKISGRLSPGREGGAISERRITVTTIPGKRIRTRTLLTLSVLVQ
jgi:hypothetical protein